MAFTVGLDLFLILLRKYGHSHAFFLIPHHHHRHHQLVSSHYWAKASPICRHRSLSFDCLFQATVPVFPTNSSLHLTRGFPLFLVPYCGCHSVVSRLHFSLLARCPTHLHLDIVAVFITSITFVWFLMHTFFAVSSCT